MKNFLSILLLSLVYISTNNFASDYVSQHIFKVQEKEEIDSVAVPVGEPIIASITMYYAVVGQCDSSPLVTADGSKIDPLHASEHKWVAVSQDLLKRNGGDFSFNDYVEIKGTKDKDGIYQIHDVMNKRYKKYVDILETKNTPLYKYTNVTIQKVLN